MKYVYLLKFCIAGAVVNSILLAFLMLCSFSSDCAAQSVEYSSGNGGNIGELLGPLQTLHDDLSRIEGKLDAFINAKWEYKILVPNVLGNSKFDPYEPNLGPLGAEGWELVTYSPDVGYILKRRVMPKQ
ncbi:hypothetical protein [Maridesulfovibrio sp.]|uniref:hypothetical protein n=1 Tax=Maridesulfovibrio sp. TaxID=2795000 RepID=UPI0029F51CD9|nr:hypothetical protein [Maridesulfovibrio sp.]